MRVADVSIVYFNPEAIKHKRLKELDPELIKKAFNRKDLIIITDKDKLFSTLISYNWLNTNILMMSSGNFGGFDYQELINRIE